MWLNVMLVTPAVLKHLMFVNQSVSVIQAILSFVIPLASLFPNFDSDCHSVKLVHKLIDVSWKHSQEWLVNNKSSCQHDFIKPFRAMNILMMSIHIYELVLLFFIFHHNFCNNNVDNFFKGYVKCNIFSTNEFLMPNSFIYHEFNSVAIFNIPDKNV